MGRKTRGVCAGLLLISFQMATAIAHSYERTSDFYRLIPTYTRGQGVQLAQQNEAELLSFKSLLKNRHKFSDTESFLSFLKRQSPEMFQRPVLLHSTGSLQHASFDNPRVLLFSGGSVFSFDSVDGVPGSNVEMIEYDFKSHSFNMREISFSKDQPAIFNARPTSCAACHGVDPKPLWPTYDLWPTAYGSKASFLGSDREWEKYRDFIIKSSKGSIYKYLEELPQGDSPKVIKLSANDSFTQFIQNLANLRFRSTLKKSNTLEPFRYAIAAGLGGCFKDNFNGSIYKVDDFLPNHIQQAFAIPRKHFQNDVARARALLLQYNQDLYGRVFSGELLSTELSKRLDYENELNGEVRYILENLGFSFRKYTTGHGVGDFSFAVPSNVMTDGQNFSIYIYPEWEKELNVEVGKVVADTELSFPRLSCEELSERSRSELKDHSIASHGVVESFDDVGSNLTPMARCIRCHSAEIAKSRFAPFIPFDDSMAFRSWLSQGSNYELIKNKVSTGAMPMESTLTPQEKSALLEAIDVLAGSVVAN